MLKSPFEKGELGEISGPYINPPCPPFSKESVSIIHSYPLTLPHPGGGKSPLLERGARRISPAPEICAINAKLDGIRSNWRQFTIKKAPWVRADLIDEGAFGATGRSYGFSRRGTTSASPSRGNWRVKVEPFPGLLSTRTAPPCSCMMLWQMASPSPVPFSLVVK